MGRTKARHAAETTGRKVTVLTKAIAFAVAMIILVAVFAIDSVKAGTRIENTNRPELEAGEVLYTMTSSEEETVDNTDTTDDSEMESDTDDVNDVFTDIGMESNTNDVNDVFTDIGMESDTDTVTDAVTNSDVVGGNSISYTVDELSLFTRLVYAEAGGEDEAGITATAWVIRNRIETRNGSFYDAIFEPNAFEPANAIYGEIATRAGYVITDDDVTENVRDIARRVLNGTIPSPVKDWQHFLGFKVLGFEDGYEFANYYSIEEYCIIGNTIFFEEWNQQLNADY